MGSNDTAKLEMGDNLPFEMMHLTIIPEHLRLSLFPLSGLDLDWGLLSSQMFPPRTSPSGLEFFSFFPLRIKDHFSDPVYSTFAHTKSLDCLQLPAKVLSFRWLWKKYASLGSALICKGMKTGQMQDLLMIISSASTGKCCFFLSAFSIPLFFSLSSKQSTFASSPVALRLFRASVCGSVRARVCMCLHSFGVIRPALKNPPGGSENKVTLHLSWVI